MMSEQRHHLFCDFETRSDVNIGKCGAFKYMESPEFRPLLLAWGFDHEPLKLVDFACGDTWPEEFLAALDDPAVTMVAHNNAFERGVIAHELHYSPDERWIDTMHLFAQCGLPLSLDGAGKAMGLSEEEGKMREGKALIRYFCQPCKPTKANGGRTWNLPEHAPDKWETFRAYCLQDVEAMRTMFYRCQQWLPRPEEMRFHALDARINEKGVRIDRQLAKMAVAMDLKNKEELTAQAVAITGMENPKSVSQIKQWLFDQEGKEFPSLNKKVIADVVANLQTDEAKKFMSIRTELAKSSVAKYDAMLRSMCADDHVRGCFAFYGANRTGRFCLTGDHEVLTQNGWVRLDQWGGGIICQWNPTVDLLSFQAAEAVSFPFEGNLIRINAQRCQQLSTAEHKMPVRGKDGKIEPRTMGELINRGRFLLPLRLSRSPRMPGDADQLRVLVMVQADGCYHLDGTLSLGFKKARKIERCKHLLRRVGVPFVVDTFENGVTRFRVPQKDQPLWLRAFRDKTFGWWLLDEDASVFVDELENWDAYRCGPNSIQYTTTNKQNADVIQALLQTNGYSATLLTKVRGPEHPEWSDAYILNICLTPGKDAGILRRQMSEVPYAGTVYCAQTKTGYFLVRRNGTVWVTGNSGRLVQFQNLSKNHMDGLDDCRSLVRDGHYSAVKILYDGVSDVLSQLVRTAIVPEEGHRILVSDFSAIEARVLAWLAGEEWVLDAFRNGEDIYCKTASAMFKVPVVKHGENGHLRSKGKVAVLACIAEDQLVLTDRGLVPIQDVLRSDLVWDGAAWVQHEGVIYKGEREVITYDGLTATPDHLVYIEGTPGPIRFADAASCGARLIRPRTPWSCHRKCGGHFLGETLVEKLESLLRPDPVRHVRACAVDRLGQPAARCKPWLSKLLPAAARVSEMAVQTNVGSEGAMFESPTPKLGQLRRAWDHLRLSLRQSCLRMDRPGTGTSEERPTDGARPDRQRQGLRTGQSALGHAEGELCESTLHADRRVASGGLAVYPQRGGSEAQGREDAGRNTGRRLAGRAGEKKKLARHKKVVRVYDIRNAGPQHRFTVSGVLVHNCGYGGGVNALKAFGADKMGMTDEEMQETVDLWRESNPRICQLWRSLEKAAIKAVARKGATTDALAGIRFDYEQGVLWMTLPSGRRIAYWGAKYEPGKRSPERKVLSYMGVNQQTKKWERVETWGGKIVENLTQATARDCLRDAMFALDEAGFDIRAHVHDEVIITEPVDGRTWEDVAEIMSRPLPWAEGLPLNAAGYDGAYYFKD